MKFLSSKAIATALFATTVVLSGMVSPADAKPKSSSDGVTLDCNVLDITGATACAGPFDGNDSQGDKWSIELNNNDIFGDYTWYEADKIDVVEGASSLESDFFKISYDQASSAEQWSVGTIEFLKDIDFQFAMSLKTSTNWNLYSFDGVTQGTILDFDTINVARTGKNNSGNSGKALSHSTLYISDNSVNSNPNPQEVPEPVSLLGLLAVATMGAGSVLKHKQK